MHLLWATKHAYPMSDKSIDAFVSSDSCERHSLKEPRKSVYDYHNVTLSFATGQWSCEVNINVSDVCSDVVMYVVMYVM